MSKARKISLLIASVAVASGYYFAANIFTINTGEVIWFLTYFFGSMFNVILPNPDINNIVWWSFSIGQAVQFVFIYFLSMVIVNQSKLFFRKTNKMN